MGSKGVESTRARAALACAMQRLLAPSIRPLRCDAAIIWCIGAAWDTVRCELRYTLWCWKACLCSGLDGAGRRRVWQRKRARQIVGDGIAAREMGKTEEGGGGVFS